MFKRAAIGLAVLGLSGIVMAKASEPPNIVTTIRPIYSLTAAITQGVTEPILLLRGQASPHHYALRPSEVRRLQQADLIFWVGPQLETFLPKVLASLGQEQRAIRLDKSPGLSKLAVRTGGEWEPHTHGGHGHDHDEDDEHDHNHDSEHGSHEMPIDPHVWLSVPNAIKMAQYITQVLVQADPSHKERYRENAALLTQQLQALHREIKQSLGGLQRVPFLVFHDGYHYFEKTYGLNGVGAIVLDAEISPSVHRMQALQEKIKRLRVRCIFSEPQFNSKSVQMLTANAANKIEVGTLDPLGQEGPQPALEYFDTMRALTQHMLVCLRAKE